jgi:hypothetical protein
VQPTSIETRKTAKKCLKVRYWWLESIENYTVITTYMYHNPQHHDLHSTVTGVATIFGI